MKKSIKSQISRKESNYRIINSALILTLLATFPVITRNKGTVLGKIESKDFRLYVAIPVLCIAFAELLVFSGRIAAAVFVHIGILVALSLSNIFINDPRVHKIYMPLMLLPLLRLVNLSVPIFYESSLYSFVFVYGPLAIPVIAIIMHQRNSFEKIGITSKNLLPYMVLSVPLGFLLGFGEYITIRPGYLVPDITFGSLLKLAIVMIFFVGLVEELIFRSIIQTRLEKMLNVREALIIVSLLFGFMHSGYGNFYELLYSGFAGFIVGFIFYKTRSLPFVAVLHGISNVFLFGILPHYMIAGAWF